MVGDADSIGTFTGFERDAAIALTSGAEEAGLADAEDDAGAEGVDGETVPPDCAKTETASAAKMNNQTPPAIAREKERTGKYVRYESGMNFIENSLFVRIR